MAAALCSIANRRITNASSCDRIDFSLIQESRKSAAEAGKTERIDTKWEALQDGAFLFYKFPNGQPKGFQNPKGKRGTDFSTAQLFPACSVANYSKPWLTVPFCLFCKFFESDVPAFQTKFDSELFFLFQSGFGGVLFFILNCFGLRSKTNDNGLASFQTVVFYSIFPSLTGHIQL